MTTLLHFHIGPVERFISESRRTRDYWAGSFLLSRLCGEAMHAVESKACRIIRPVIADRALGSADPTLRAVRESKSGFEEGPFVGTLPNRFTAEFKTRDAANEAGSGAERAVRLLWVNLAAAIWNEILEGFTFLKDETRAKDVNRRWKAQIGTESYSPLWEIYWVTVPNTKETSPNGWDPLDLRKISRIEADEAGLPDKEGNFCTMMPGFCDISGLQRRGQSQDVLNFWRAVRQHLVDLRYPSKGLAADTCLDLRPNERLSAPALVKRLFPMLVELHPNSLTDNIRWIPHIRPAFSNWVSDELLDGLLQPLLKFMRGEPGPSKSAKPTPDSIRKQSALFWPSTSYIAATHWIARTQREAPRLCDDFREAIARIGPHYTLAERSLYLRCVYEGLKNAPLAWIDGAMFHENRLNAVGSDPKDSSAVRPDNKLTAALKALNALHKVKISRRLAMESEPDENGPPPKHYAIILADVDHVGKTLNDPAKREFVSRTLGEFSQRLRGNETAEHTDDQYGVAAARNGVLLYGGADEAMIFAPPEDAVDIAAAIYQAFEDSKKPDLPELTVSASILLADVRAPMRWAIEEAKKLLHTTAKDHAGRDALALAVFDIDGCRSPWAAPWKGANGTNPVCALRNLIEAASTQHPFIWSNGFYHRLSDRLAAFLVPERCRTFQEVISHCNRGDEGTATIGDRDMVEALIRKVVAEHLPLGTAEAKQEIAGRIIELTTCCYRGEDGKPHGEKSSVVLAPMDFLRVLGNRWCKDGVAETRPAS